MIQQLTSGKTTQVQLNRLHEQISPFLAKVDSVQAYPWKYIETRISVLYDRGSFECLLKESYRASKQAS